MGDAGLLERHRPGQRAGRRREVGLLADVPVRLRAARAEHVDRRLREVLGPLGRRHDERAAAVGDHAAVEQVQRVGDHPRVEHVVDGDRVAGTSRPG